MKSGAPTLDPDRRTAPQIYAHLRNKIIGLEIEPNTVLVRSNLQQMFGVSQTPVRDALMKLESEGLVEVFPQHATRVSRINVRLAREAHFMRLAVELEAISIATLKRTDDDLAKMEALIELQKEAGETGDFHRFAELDQQFHAEFYRLASVSNLFDLVKARSVHIDRLRKLNLPLPGKRNAVLQDHLLITDAIRNRDVDGARQQLRRHLSGTLSIISEIAARYPDFLSEI